MIDAASVPFYANTDDDTHCFQAGMKMMLGCFMPGREFSWEELDRMSHKQPGLSTWPQAMLIELDKLGFDVVMVEAFDGRAFIRDGEQYLRDTYDGDTAEWQIANSDITAEQALYQQAFDRGISIEHRVPDLDEMKDKLAQGYLVSCNLNSRKLNDQPGYVGHFVVVLSIDDETVLLHDPGLPPQPSRSIPRAVFEAAWADPNAQAKNYIAIRPK